MFLSNLLKPSTRCGRLEVSTVVLLSIYVFWDVTMCSWVSTSLVSNECNASSVTEGSTKHAKCEVTYADVKVC